MIRTLTSNTRNIIGHQVASLLAVTKNIGDILRECQTSAVGIIASKNHIIIVIIRSQDRVIGWWWGDGHLQAPPDWLLAPTSGIMNTSPAPVWLPLEELCYGKKRVNLVIFRASRYIHRDSLAKISKRCRILDLKYRAWFSSCIESWLW